MMLLKLGSKNLCRKLVIMKSFLPIATPIGADGVDLKEVGQFTNLGCNIENDGEVRSKNGIKIGKAGAAFRIVNKV